MMSEHLDTVLTVSGIAVTLMVILMMFTFFTSMIDQFILERKENKKKMDQKIMYLVYCQTWLEGYGVYYHIFGIFDDVDNAEREISTAVANVNASLPEEKKISDKDFHIEEILTNEAYNVRFEDFSDVYETDSSKDSFYIGGYIE